MVHREIKVVDIWLSISATRYISTPPVCLHGIDGNNFTYGKEDSVNIVNVLGNAVLYCEMLLYLLYML
jgi:hypothetical protein